MRLVPSRRQLLPAAPAVPVLLVALVAGLAPVSPPGGEGPTVRAVPANGPLGYVEGADDPLDDELEGAHPVTFPQGTGVAVRPAVSRDGKPAPDLSDTALPARVLAAYKSAATSLRRSDPGCGLTWPLLAGIGKVESGHAYGGAVDRAGLTLTPILGPVLDGSAGVAAIPDTDDGRLDTDKNWDRAVGPMQFIPSSWRIHGQDGNGDGDRDPHNVVDAALASAGYLCTGDRDLSREEDRRAAVFSYNHSWDYVDLVLAWADAYADGTAVLTGALPWGEEEPLGRAGGSEGSGGSTPVAAMPGEPPGAAQPSPAPSTDEPAAAGASAGPTTGPTAEPTTEPSAARSTEPSASSSTEPSTQPSTQPSTEPTAGPTTEPPSPDPTSTPSTTCPTPTGEPSPSESPAGGTTEPTPSPTQVEATTTPDPTPTETPLDPCAGPTPTAPP